MAKKRQSKEEAPLKGEVNIFENPEEGLIEGSDTQLAVLADNDVDGPDEDMSPEEEKEARKYLDATSKMIKKLDDFYWELSERLANVFNKKMYRVLGHKTVDGYLKENEFERRKAYYLVQLHSYFNLELKQSFGETSDEYKFVIDNVKKIGWTKASKIATNKVLTKDNAKEVIGKAIDFSVKELELWIKNTFAAMTEEEQMEAEDDNDLKTVPMSFQCTLPQKRDIDEAITAALSTMKEGASKSSALSMICRDFMATNALGKDREVNVAEVLSKYERLLDVTLIAIDDQAGAVVYGMDNIERLSASMKDESEEGGVFSGRPEASATV